jgi:uncharacterized membrane protein YgdD (TMEM256/DUF423 family)
MNRTAIKIAAFFGASAVILGAFGAHGLAKVLSANGTLAIWQTASQYHLLHSVALLILATQSPRFSRSGILFCAGIIIFSGSLYTLAVSNLKLLGAITPIGGVCLIIGWILLAFDRPS